MVTSKIGILEQADQVSLGSLLERHHSGRLEAEIGLSEGMDEQIVYERNLE